MIGKGAGTHKRITCWGSMFDQLKRTRSGRRRVTLRFGEPRAEGDHLSVVEVQRRTRNQLTVQFRFLDGLVYSGDRLLHFPEIYGWRGGEVSIRPAQCPRRISIVQCHGHSFRICPGSCSTRLAETDVRGSWFILQLIRW